MKQVIIGKAGNQPFKITDEYVSSRHAVFTFDNVTGQMTIADNNSTNGTYVKMGNQFQRIGQCHVDAATDIRLGPYFTFRVGQLFQAPQPPEGPEKKGPEKPKVEKADIGYLRKVAETYETKKIELEQKQANIGGLRMLTMVGSLAGALLGGGIPSLLGVDKSDENFLLYSSIGPALALLFMIALQIYCSKASKAIIRKRNENDKTYKISFCCPKCHMPFAGKLYENILAEGKCPKCKTEFYDSRF